MKKTVKNESLKKLLMEAGLLEKDVLVYLELMTGGCEKVWDLVGRTGMSKSSVYRAFKRLEEMKLVREDENGVKANSLRNLVLDVEGKSRSLRRLGARIRKLAPFLSEADDFGSEIEVFTSLDQICEAYMMMADLDYGVCLDFGDFEGFIELIGGCELGAKFRRQRMRHASNHAICTTYGPNTDFFCNQEARVKFKQDVDILPVDFRGNFMVLSDRSDYVLFADSEDPDNVFATLVKSKYVADAQRKQFDLFSQLVGK